MQKGEFNIAISREVMPAFIKTDKKSTTTILKCIILLAGLSAVLAGCNSGYNCDSIGDLPYNFAKSQIPKKELFERTLYYYKLKEGDYTIFLTNNFYKGGLLGIPLQLELVEVFRAINDPNQEEDLIGISYSNELGNQTLFVYKGKQAIKYEKDDFGLFNRWTKVCSEIETDAFGHDNKGLGKPERYSEPEPFFGLEKKHVGKKEIQKYLDLIEEIKQKFPESRKH